MLAYKTMGIYDSLSEASSEMVKSGKKFTPDREGVKVYREGYGSFKKLVIEFHGLYPLHDEEFLPGS